MRKPELIVLLVGLAVVVPSVMVGGFAFVAGVAVWVALSAIVFWADTHTSWF